LDDSELEELSRKYARYLAPHIGPNKDIPAPDVNTDSRIIDWMVDEFEIATGDKTKASFTGKSLANRGSLGRDAATGRGGVIALKELLKLLNLSDKNITLAIQGFGNVGSFFCKIAQEEQPNWNLLAAGDSRAAVFSASGLDTQQLDSYKSAGGSFKDFKTCKIISNEELLALDVDVLVLAALEDSVTKDNMEKISAKYILELANGPIDEEAQDYLTDKGAIIIPDIIANSGGVIVSYFEWLQNCRSEKWDKEKVNSQLENYMAKAVKKLYKTANQRGVSYKEAAFMNAINNLLH